MAGPWEKYQKPAEEAGPWSKFAVDAASHNGPTEVQKEAPQTFGHFAGNFMDAMNPLPIFGVIRHPIDTAKGMWGAMQDQADKARQDFAQHHYLEGTSRAVASALPGIGPAAANKADQIAGEQPVMDRYGATLVPGSAPDPVGGAGGGAGLVTSVLAAPRLVRGAGRATEATARPLVKSALGLPGKAEAYGATPAKAVLEETSGVRPSTVAESARERLGVLGRELDAKAAAATEKPSLQPARDIVEGRITKARAANSADTPTELEPMRRFLVRPGPGFAGDVIETGGQPEGFRVGPGGERMVTSPAVDPVPEIAPTQPAPQFLGMKRQFDTDFIRNWNPAVSTKGRLGVARQAYGAMADEFNRAVPGAEGLNQRISSLIPAAERARLSDLNAGGIERAINRATRPTGGLFPLLFGFHEGGIPGALTTLAGQEALGSPTFKMMGARGIYGLGRGIGSAPAQRAVQAGPFLRQRD